MQTIAEEIQKLVVTGRIFKEDSPRNEETAKKIYETAIASCMKFSEELIKNNVSVVIHTWKWDSKFVHAEKTEYVR